MLQENNRLSFGESAPAITFIITYCIQHSIKARKKTWNRKISGLFGGDKRDRTADLLNAIQALSQLSYTPILYRLAADLINIADLPQNVKPYFWKSEEIFQK